MNPPFRGRHRCGLTYWAIHYQQAPFYHPGFHFRDYAPALYLGISGFIAWPDSPFEFLLPKLCIRYPSLREGSLLTWKNAIPVIWAAWERASTTEQTARH